jgi:hypothetical protein
MRCLLLVGRKIFKNFKKKEREMARGLFSQGWTRLADYATPAFSQLLGAIKG